MRLSNIIITLTLILLYSKQINKETILFLFSSILLLLFANFQNDYIDREIDLKKGKRKFIISPLLQLSLMIISLIISIFINVKTFILFSIMAILINFYNLFATKKPYGFLITSLIITLGILNLGFAFGFKENLIYLLIFAFLFNTLREIVKSFIDYNYDFGFRETIAIKISKQKTKILIKFLLLFVLISLIICSIFINNLKFWVYTIFSVFITMPYFLNVYNEKIFSNFLKLLMFLGFLALLL
ncbi:MAG: UbiA family prenyltransferase [candidate division WOR-3 bacterium]